MKGKKIIELVKNFILSWFIHAFIFLIFKLIFFLLTLLLSTNQRELINVMILYSRMEYKVN